MTVGRIVKELIIPGMSIETNPARSLTARHATVGAMSVIKILGAAFIASAVIVSFVCPSYLKSCHLSKLGRHALRGSALAAGIVGIVVIAADVIGGLCSHAKIKGEKKPKQYSFPCEVNKSDDFDSIANWQKSLLVNGEYILDPDGPNRKIYTRYSDKEGRRSYIFREEWEVKKGGGVVVMSGAAAAAARSSGDYNVPTGEIPLAAGVEGRETRSYNTEAYTFECKLQPVQIS